MWEFSRFHNEIALVGAVNRCFAFFSVREKDYRVVSTYTFGLELRCISTRYRDEILFIHNFVVIKKKSLMMMTKRGVERFGMRSISDRNPTACEINR